MIRIRGRAAVYGEVWYDEQAPRACGADILVYRQIRSPIAHAPCTPFVSLVTDLSVDEDSIAGNFGRDCLYKIRRAERRDELRSEFITAPRDRLDGFRSFFDAFARQRALAPCDQHWLESACEAGQLALSSATQNGEALVWHAYVMAGSTAGLMYTGSCFREKASDYRALIGRANRWLHHRDMLRLRELGMTRYDWGGLFEEESSADRAGINRFKKDFGGESVRSFDCSVALTLRGRLYLPMRDTWRRLAAAAHRQPDGGAPS